MQAAGFVVEEVTKNTCSGYLQVGEAHRTPWGVVHGGVYTAAVESAASIGASAAVAEQGQVAVGLTNTTQFLRSITEGRLRVEAQALHQGRTQQLWVVEIIDARGRRIAHGELRLQNVDASTA
ncbi:MAG TPA: PaaI family thioesterase [Acidimicrobiales bacterium]|nr:PaaI family thioesterase [Acidimicrobiales bacterium]